MAAVSIELNDEQARKLRELAVQARMSEQDICRDALEKFLQDHPPPTGGRRPVGRAALEAMIGLVKDGPADLSIRHDRRQDEPP
jgi:hypothetical protein